MDNALIQNVMVRLCAQMVNPVLIQINYVIQRIIVAIGVMKSGVNQAAGIDPNTMMIMVCWGTSQNIRNMGFTSFLDDYLDVSFCYIIKPLSSPVYGEFMVDQIRKLRSPLPHLV